MFKENCYTCITDATQVMTESRMYYVHATQKLLPKCVLFTQVRDFIATEALRNVNINELRQKSIVREGLFTLWGK